MVFSVVTCRDGLKDKPQVARSFCLALPGCCLAKQVHLLADLCITGNIITHKLAKFSVMYLYLVILVYAETSDRPCIIVITNWKCEMTEMRCKKLAEAWAE